MKMGKLSYKDLLKKRRAEYKSYIAPFSPAIREYVRFNSDGFNHLRYHVDGRPRSPSEQMYKLGLLPLVIPVIHTATIVDKYERRLAPIGRRKKDGKRIMKEIEYWGLVAIVGKQSVRLNVVLRRIGNGNIHFWSVMKLS